MRGRSRRLGPRQGAIGFLPVGQSAGEIVRFLTRARSEAVAEPAGAHTEEPARPPHAPRPHGAGPAGARQPDPRPGLITRNRSAGTRRQAASELPRPCPLAGGPRQRPRGAAESLPFAMLPDPFPSVRGKPACSRETAPPQPSREATAGVYLVILKNDFGWDFLANDLPEDRVATRPRGLSFGDLICHLGLPPARPPQGEAREEGGAGAAGRGRWCTAKPARGPLLGRPGWSCACALATCTAVAESARELPRTARRDPAEGRRFLIRDSREPHRGLFFFPLSFYL